MNKHMTTVAALVLAGSGIAYGRPAVASDTGAERQAAQHAKAAAKEMARHRADRAVASAEAAVALAPRIAAYRALLGQAYLGAGRFNSAVAALADAVALDPADATVALHLALAQVATGDWAAAKATLALHEQRIPAADRGLALALALAGEPATAVTILMAAVRDPNADAKTRQNLALALALAGRWPESKIVAALDVSPAEIDARMMQWIVFAQPRAASDQVAALLGVSPVADPGQPPQLALRDPVSGVAALVLPVAAASASVTDVSPTATAPVAPPAPEVAEAAVAPRQEAARIVFGPRAEIVQPIAASVKATPMAPVAVASLATSGKAVVGSKTAPAKLIVRGTFQVQLGAFPNDGVAYDAWSRLSRRAAFARLTPQLGSVKVGDRTLYRLSVGGFARAEAYRLCGTLRAAGGRCFVRAVAGDSFVRWPRGASSSRIVAFRLPVSPPRL